MDEREFKLWRIVDIGGFSAYGTLFAFTLESIKNKVENGETDLQEEINRIMESYENIYARYQKIDLSLLTKNFPIDTIRKLKEDVFPELGKKYKELEILLKHYIGGATHLKVRIINKVNECQEIVKRVNELGIEFSKSERYWEYRNTNPQRIYLKGDYRKGNQ